MKIIIISHFNARVRFVPRGFHVQRKKNIGRKAAKSHAYIRIVEFPPPVEIGGLKIQSRDLLHGGLHGAQTIPYDIAARIPLAAAKIISQEQELATLCQSKNFSLEKLRAAIAETNR
ncbi:MAG: hypothetical protein ABSH48_25130 [Verrucomicrobiota bacterium]|jgi:hypothetical protein